MKKFFIIGAIVLVIACSFLGLHVGTACPADAKEFAKHAEEQGHVAEFGGADNFAGFLNLIADGSAQIAVYGDITRTIIAVTSSQYGPRVIIYGTGVLPTGFPATTSRINDLTRGMTPRTGKTDLNAARNTAGCFGKSFQTQSIAVSLPVSSAASAATIATILALVGIGGLFLGERKVLGDGSPA